MVYFIVSIHAVAFAVDRARTLVRLHYWFQFLALKLLLVITGERGFLAHEESLFSLDLLFSLAEVDCIGPETTEAIESEENHSSEQAAIHYQVKLHSDLSQHIALVVEERMDRDRERGIIPVPQHPEERQHKRVGFNEQVAH